MNNEKIAEAVVKTLAYFSLYQYPLTLAEIQSQLLTVEKTSSTETLKSLNFLIEKKVVGFSNGFYFLFGENIFVKTRQKKYADFWQKIKKIRIYLRILSAIPFVKAIFVCNETSLQNSASDSDLDLAIITKAKRLWLCRFFANFTMKILNARPKKNYKKNKICLSFWLDENFLNLKKITFANDIRLAYWLKNFWPVYLSDEKILQKLKDENTWLNEFFGEINFKTQIEPFIFYTGFLKIFFEKILNNKFGDFLTKILKIFQLKIMPKRLKRLAKIVNSGVLVSDQICKLHLNDDREIIAHRWLQKTQKFLAKI